MFFEGEEIENMPFVCCGGLIFSLRRKVMGSDVFTQQQESNKFYN